MRDCGKLIQNFKERGIQQMCCFVILLLFNEMQMSVQRFSTIPHLRDKQSQLLRGGVGTSRMDLLPRLVPCSLYDET